MVYLTAFYWGWLLASALLGLAMGWISVVQHGEGASKNLKRWLAVLAAARSRSQAMIPMKARRRTAASIS